MLHNEHKKISLNVSAFYTFTWGWVLHVRNGVLQFPLQIITSKLYKSVPFHSFDIQISTHFPLLSKNRKEIIAFVNLHIHARNNSFCVKNNCSSSKSCRCGVPNHKSNAPAPTDPTNFSYSSSYFFSKKEKSVGAGCNSGTERQVTFWRHSFWEFETEHFKHSKRVIKKTNKLLNIV